MIITNKPDAFDVDVKRFHLPAVVKTTCPKCGEEVVRDFTDDYLHYPVANVPMLLHLGCDVCEHEWSTKIVLRIQLEPAP